VASEPNTYLLESDRPEVVTAVQHALTAAGIPYLSGLHTDARPRVAFWVPWDRLREARRVVDAVVVDEPDFSEDETEPTRPVRSVPAGFPWTAVQWVAAVTLVHLALVFVGTGPRPLVSGLLERGGIIAGALTAEPWRLLSAMMLHVDVRHVLWNAVSMLVFAVPLIAYLGVARSAVIYLAAGLGGGLCAGLLARQGAVILGSSGAVAGLFGAWVVLALRRARLADLGWHARVRSLGIALLVLPSLLSPITPQGRPVSVASHVGGLLTGMLIGGLISRGLLDRIGDELVRVD